MISDWISANTSVAGGWGFAVERIRAGSKVIDTAAYYVSHELLSTELG